MLCTAITAQQPWANGKLRVSDNQRFLQFENGKPFFWLGETAWLMPEHLNREEVDFYLATCHEAGYNMTQVQVLNDVPSYNIYGVPSHDRQGRLFTSGAYTYWDHMDYIVDQAARNGIYIGIVHLGRAGETGQAERGAGQDLRRIPRQPL